MEEPRWKIACINWGHPDTVKFMSYVAFDGAAKLAEYHYTHAEALARVAAVSATLAKAGPDAIARALRNAR